MNVKLGHEPPSWKKNNPAAIARWMQKLPGARNIEELIENDQRYDAQKEN